MKASLAKAITAVYIETENEFEEKSTEFILEVAAQRCHERKIKPNCDHGDVVDAVIQEGVYKK